jgi:Mg2+ and Co2+ transporter CorA
LLAIIVPHCFLIRIFWLDVITMLQSLTHYDSILARAHSNYLTAINIEITQASNKTNDVMAKLTTLATVVVPFNLVTSEWRFCTMDDGAAS